MPQLRTALDDAIHGFVDRVGDIVSDAAVSTPKRTAHARKRASKPNTSKGLLAPTSLKEGSPPVLAATTLGRKVLRVVSENPQGVTANDIADELHVGFAPIFDELRSLMASGALVRIVRGDDQLPVYVLSNK